MKLIKTIQSISIFKKGESNPNNYFEIDISHISLDEIKLLIKARKRDPHYFEGYTLNKKQIEKVNPFLKEKIIPDFRTTFYVFSVSGEYEE